MSVKCRLRPLQIPKEIESEYSLKSIYDSDLIRRQIFTEGKNPKDFDKLDVYDCEEVFTSRSRTLGKKIVVEICCGTGDFINAFAGSQPDTSFIGIDYARAVIQRALIKTHERRLNNLLYYNGRAEDFFYHDFKFLQADLILVNFPDPWPKKRHHKRRVISKRSVEMISRALKLGGELITATDVEALHKSHKESLAAAAALKSLLTDKEELIPPLSIYADTAGTSTYEKKGVSGKRAIRYTRHQKIA